MKISKKVVAAIVKAANQSVEAQGNPHDRESGLAIGGIFDLVNRLGEAFAELDPNFNKGAFLQDGEL